MLIGRALRLIRAWILPVPEIAREESTYDRPVDDCLCPADRSGCVQRTFDAAAPPVTPTAISVSAQPQLQRRSAYRHAATAPPSNSARSIAHSTHDGSKPLSLCSCCGRHGVYCTSPTCDYTLIRTTPLLVFPTDRGLMTVRADGTGKMSLRLHFTSVKRRCYPTDGIGARLGGIPLRRRLIRRHGDPRRKAVTLNLHNAGRWHAHAHHAVVLAGHGEGDQGGHHRRSHRRD